mgnify:CR=1 FL=1
MLVVASLRPKQDNLNALKNNFNAKLILKAVVEVILIGYANLKIKEKINFKDFVKMTLKLNNHHWDEQYYFIRSKPDFIGRFENLQEDFDKLCDLTSLPKKELPYKNATQHFSYENYYDDETRAIVAKKYAKDIECFGYKFGN